ncbi:MAG TPA: DNA replication and repair protein RecF [Gemmatimonadales bacterium]|jgi:DNA replication and repair protein RecF
MRAAALVVRSFRNLAEATLELPADGVALVGPNGHGKTNLLEALAYPVLFRSLRGSPDREVVGFGGPGFHVTVQVAGGDSIATTYYAAERRKRISVGDVDQPTVAAAMGQWLAVGFLPTDLALVQGGAAERRRWMDRMLSLSDRRYLTALLRYRAALAQRNAALRVQQIEAADAFNPALAEAGALLVTLRRHWVAEAAERWRTELDSLGEIAPVLLRYKGDDLLTDIEPWDDRLRASAARDLARGQTHVGPHRDDLVLALGGHALRDYGSTGQQRSAAIALRLLELETLAGHRGVRPALLVDDVFAELDHDRQRRLAIRLLAGPGQRVVTAPRSEDIPAELDLPRWLVRDGAVAA